jgi:GNAT superfamily N-acetyltransferase
LAKKGYHLKSINTERIRLTHTSGDTHEITVSFCVEDFRVELTAIYEQGAANLRRGDVIAQWESEYLPPSPHGDRGQVTISGIDGRIDILFEALRGFGLGSFLMHPIVSWIKKRQVSVPVAGITLSGDDARTDRERDIRNRFYEKLGFQFEYKGNKNYGESIPMDSHNLVTPPARLSDGWQWISIENPNSIFESVSPLSST